MYIPFSLSFCLCTTRVCLLQRTQEYETNAITRETNCHDVYNFETINNHLWNVKNRHYYVKSLLSTDIIFICVCERLRVHFLSNRRAIFPFRSFVYSDVVLCTFLLFVGCVRFFPFAIVIFVPRKTITENVTFFTLTIRGIDAAVLALQPVPPISS